MSDLLTTKVNTPKRCDCMRGWLPDRWHRGDCPAYDPTRPAKSPAKAKP